MLLPSKELRELSKRVDICLSGKTAPKGCDIRYRQLYWLIVFDSGGELMAACRLSDRLGKLTKSGKSLPEAFVSIVDGGLKATPSLEQLERRYVKERGSETSYKALRAKVESMDGVGQMRLAAFLGEAAQKTGSPALSRARGILVEAHACDHQVINHAAYAKLRKSIESYIRDHPGHAPCGDLIPCLANVALKYTFDLRARCRDYAKAWSGTASDPKRAGEGLDGLSRQLLAHCEAEIALAEKKLRGMKPKDYGRLRLQARLGLAQETLDGLDAARAIGVMRPIHAEWRKDARAKVSKKESPKN